MTEAAGGLESAARPRGVERVKFPCFDGFRALAAISVLITHVAYLSGFDIHSPLGALTARMDVGVAVFFMISGFLLYRPFVASRLEGRRGPRPAAYFWRRALRILPAYWLALTVTVFVLHVPKELPSAKSLLLYYALLHPYNVDNFFGPILSSYTLTTEISFYVFLPVYAFVIARTLGTTTPQVQVRREFAVLAGLVTAGVVYRAAVTAAHFDAPRTAQLQNILPGWIDVFAIGMTLALVSAWITRRRVAAPAGLDRRRAPACSWALAAAAFLAISLWIGKPPRGQVVYTFWEDMGIHYMYLAVALFFLLPGIFGPQRDGGVRRLLRSPAVVFLGLISYGLYLWNETLMEKYIEWTSSTAFNTSFPVMLLAVFVATSVVATISYVVLERPVLSLKPWVPDRRPARATVA
jgi:peptidoglycan/LPS O-acetylase OafA/YrhL